MTRFTTEPVIRGGRALLQPLQLDIPAGQFIALVGPNGAGKSTLLKVMTGLLPGLQNPHTPTAKDIAYLPQTPIAPARATVRDIVALGRTPYATWRGKLSPEDAEIVAKTLTENDLAGLADRRYVTLSGGEQARVHLARALAVQAPLLLADEPTTALDPRYQLATLDRLKAYSEAGKTVIAALHDLSFAHRYADRVWVLSDGHLVQNAAPETALSATVLADIFGVKLGPTGLQKL
jgi:iron complex transport system ATP-binding protein